MSITLKETLDCVTYYATDGTEVSVALDEIHPDLVEAVTRYGLKQILADGGAASKGTSDYDRMLKMDRRADALRDGTWGLRPARSLVDEDVFVAACAAGCLVDTAETRAKWAGLSKKERNAVRALPEVAAALPRSTAGQSILAMFGRGDLPETDDPIYGSDAETEPTVVTVDDETHIVDMPKRGRGRKAA